ncbi:MAG: hypothetical protein WC725_04910 [Patescibacteria group bacterium]|jgi:hypothetical protein
MAKFKINVHWEMYDIIEIEAPTLKDAIAIVNHENFPLPATGEYLDDSFRVDEEYCETIEEDFVTISINDHQAELLKQFASSDNNTTKTVIELCPHCEHEATLELELHDNILAKTCPNCGKQLMLCSECPNSRCNTCPHKPTVLKKYSVMVESTVMARNEDEAMCIADTIPFNSFYEGEVLNASSVSVVELQPQIHTVSVRIEVNANNACEAQRLTEAAINVLDTGINIKELKCA